MQRIQGHTAHADWFDPVYLVDPLYPKIPYFKFMDSLKPNCYLQKSTRMAFKPSLMDIPRCPKTPFCFLTCASLAEDDEGDLVLAPIRQANVLFSTVY